MKAFLKPKVISKISLLILSISLLITVATVLKIINKSSVHNYDKRAEEKITTEEKILYEDNGFSFYYPGSLEMYQAYIDGVQWKPKNINRLEGSGKLDALTLHESNNPFPVISKGATYTIWNKKYPDDPKSEVIVSALTEDTVPLSQNKTKIFTIICGENCHYAVVRFTSNKKTYELIYNLNLGDISVFNDILASLNFYDPNSNSWRTYTNQEGKYSIQYPSSATFIEKVYLSVDGVRGYSKNRSFIFLRKSVPREGGFQVHFEKIGDMTLDEYLEYHDGCSADLIDETKYFKLNNEPAIYQGTLCGPAGSSDVYVKHKDVLYLIRETWPEDPMLTKFKFVD